MIGSPRLPGQGTSLALEGEGWCLLLEQAHAAMPRMVHFGALTEARAGLYQALATHAAGNTADEPPGATLWPLPGGGDWREPALLLDGIRPAFSAAEGVTTPGTLELRYAADGLVLRLLLKAKGSLLATSARLHNQRDQPVRLRWLASLALPLPPWVQMRRVFDGRWGREWQAADMRLPPGRHEQLSREARPGFGGGQWALLGEGEEQGRWLGAHLAWSGSHRCFIETGADRQPLLQMGAWLGEDGISIAPGAGWASPEALVALSDAGLVPVADAFHREARQQVRPMRDGPAGRKVHFNSWEAVWFDVSEARAMALADAAADLGCERFVLDDGWFSGRVDDTAGLGNWTPCPEKFPRGLGPLIAHVEQLGMEFGLWVEPEMASPESTLLRAHPDWALSAPLHRHQHALDMARPDVRDHLFCTLDHLLKTHRIACLKWDHNRPVDAPDPDAHARGSRDLVQRVSQAHPHVLIEGCASGGGRLAFDLLPHMGRVWPSDTSDPAARLDMQHSLSIFLPTELCGSHVAASPNPISGARHSMDFRAKVALFGHMGVEVDPASLSTKERDRLRALVALYKSLRGLISTGRTRWPRSADPALRGQLAIAPDGSQAVALVASAAFQMTAQSTPCGFPGLLPDALYRVTLPEPWPPAGRLLAEPETWRQGLLLDGRSLASTGLRLPLAPADTAWIVLFQRIEPCDREA